MRSSLVSIGGQEILSADHVAVKATLALRIRVVSPDVAVLAAKSFEEVLYLEAQLVLRDVVSALPVDDLLQKRSLVLGLSQPILPLGREEAVEADRSPKSLKVRTEEESPPDEE